MGSCLVEVEEGGKGICSGMRRVKEIESVGKILLLLLVGEGGDWVG